MSKPVRALIVIDHLGTGGAQEFVYQMARYLSPNRVQLSVAALLAGGIDRNRVDDPGIYREQLEQLGIPVYTLATSPRLSQLPLALFNLTRLLLAQRYDVVNTILQVSFVFGSPLAWLLHVPTAHSVMSARAQTQRWYFPLMSWYQHLVGLYITPIPRELTEAGIQAQKIKLVEVTVDLTEMLAVQRDAQRVIEPFDLTNAYPVALSIGRLHPDKGHEYAIRAWPYVLKQWPHARLLVVGDGNDEPRLKTLADRLDLSNSVIFTGYRRDLADLFARADLFLRTSVNEGVNLTTIQAMAAGLPTIGFKHLSPKEIIHHGFNGLLVSLGDEVALAQAILKLSNDHGWRSRIGEDGRSRVEGYYNLAHIVNFYSDLYTTIGTKRPLSDLPDMSGRVMLFDKYFADDSRDLQEAER